MRAGGDLAQNLAGHLAFQQGGWTWPALVSTQLFWPEGLNIALTDSNPLISLIAKVAVAPLMGEPTNLFGVWIALCVVLQPVAAAYAANALAPKANGSRVLLIATAAAAFSLLWPAWLSRLGHINLIGHFCLLMALGLSARAVANRRPVPVGPTVGLLTAAILIHPYLFVFSAALLAAPLLRADIQGRHARLKEASRLLMSVGCAALLHRLLGGSSGGADRGFGHYSMNLLSPIFPQRSGIFGASLPVIDATGGQYEGFNYLGAGGLLVVAVALALGWGRGWRGWYPLLGVLGCLTFLALTPRIYAGTLLVLPLPAWPWDQVFGIVRASGRAFWAVAYALVFGAIGFLGVRLPVVLSAPLFGLAIAIQAMDTTPLLNEARGILAEGEAHLPPLPVLPPGLHLFRTAPPCPAPGVAASIIDRSRLAAVRAGAALTDIRSARSPVWFNCETGLSDALETPLQAGETRLFLPPASRVLRQEALGVEAMCRSQGEAVLCARRLDVQGAQIPSGEALPTLTDELAALLATGWQADTDGTAWSEGPRATLLFRTDAAAIRLHLSGIGRRVGEPRPAVFRVNNGPPVPLTLPDLSEQDVVLNVPQPRDRNIVRIVIDLYRPIDPRARNLMAPVRRAGVQLRSVSAVSP